MGFLTRKLTRKKKYFKKYPLGLVLPRNFYRIFKIQFAVSKDNLKIHM